MDAKVSSSSQALCTALPRSVFIVKESLALPVTCVQTQVQHLRLAYCYSFCFWSILFPAQADEVPHHPVFVWQQAIKIAVLLNSTNVMTLSSAE